MALWKQDPCYAAILGEKVFLTLHYIHRLHGLVLHTDSVVLKGSEAHV